MEKTVSVVLGNGITITGTVSDVNAFAQRVGVKFDSSKYHYSKSKGEFVEIASMPATYLKNVMVKMIADADTRVYHVNPSTTLFNLLSSSAEFNALMKEYLKKIEPDMNLPF